MLRSLVLMTIGMTLFSMGGCKPIVIPAPTRKNELRIEDRSGEALSRVTVKWTNDDLVWEKKCGACGGTKADFGKPCELCMGTGSVLHPDRNFIFKLPIKRKIEPTFRIKVQFVDGETVTHEHQSQLDPEERKLITATIGKDRKIRVKEKQRNPHIE